MLLAWSAPVSSQQVFNSCDPNPLSQFSVEAGTASQSGCVIGLRGPNDAFGRAQWTGTLPAKYLVEVTLSRPDTDTMCDQLGLILGAPVSSGWNGIRVIAMSNPGLTCGGYPFGQSGRVVVENAADNTVLMLETTTATIATPIVLTIRVLPGETKVWVNHVLLGSLATSPPGTTLTLLSWDNDDESRFDSLIVDSLVGVEPSPWSAVKIRFR
jgi:hypothetical protein